VFENLCGEGEPGAIWKKLSGESKMIGKSGNLERFVSLSVSWVVIQGGASRSKTPAGEVAKGRS